MEAALTPSNLQAALKRVKQNQGGPGIDGMTVEALPDHLRVHWPSLREQLLTGRYQPQPVRRHVIPKSGGGERELGIPTVLDRFIQQALLQVLQPRFDPTFSQHSHGFRPRRSAHDAVREAKRYVQQGKRWVAADASELLRRAATEYHARARGKAPDFGKVTRAFYVWGGVAVVLTLLFLERALRVVALVAWYVDLT